MLNVALIAGDLLREAATRRWLLAVFSAITLGGVVLGFALELSVVDGVLSGTKLFGGMFGTELRTAESALRPVFAAAGWILYVAGVLFGTTVCSEFAPELLMPGRVEQLLALPVRRWQFVLGTYLGVMVIALAGSLYAAGLVTGLLGFKSGVWSAAVLAAALAASAAFASVYGVMLATATAVRSSALSAALGFGFFFVASTLTVPATAASLNSGVGRTLFELCISWLPRLWLLGRLGPALLTAESVTGAMLGAALSSVMFGLGCVAIAIWNIEGKDF